MNLDTIQQLLDRDTFLLKDARGVAFPKYWYELEGNGEIVWGVYRSSKSSAQTVLDLRYEQPATRCTCRSRKKVCKHGLALILMLLEYADAFKVVQEIPSEIKEWLDRRESRLVPKERTQEEEYQLRAIREKSWNKRLLQMSKGLQELELWLHDVMQEGLAALYNRPSSYWKEWSSHLVNAKLGRLAKRIQHLALLKNQAEWNEQLLSELGDIYLIIKGFSNIETLPIELKYELFNAIGVNTKKQELLETEGIKDHWRILAQHQGKEEKLIYQRTWLWGSNTNQFALLLDFAWGQEPFEYQWIVGSNIEASLVYYPSHFLQRALVQDFQYKEAKIHVSGYADVVTFLLDYEQAIAKNPWLTVFPAFFEEVILLLQDESLYLIDRSGTQIPCTTSSEIINWQIVASSGGNAIHVFGEWNSKQFTVLGTEKEGRWIDYSIYISRNENQWYGR